MLQDEFLMTKIILSKVIASTITKGKVPTMLHEF